MKKKLIAVRIKPSHVAILKQIAAYKENTVSELIRDLIEELVKTLAKDKRFQKILKAELRKKGKK